MAAETAAASFDVMNFVSPALILAVFYLLLLRPQQQQRKKVREMLAVLGTGDRIMTAGGIIGIVRSLEGDIVEVEIADGVVVRITKRGVVERLADDPEPVDD